MQPTAAAGVSRGETAPAGTRTAGPGCANGAGTFPQDVRLCPRYSEMATVGAEWQERGADGYDPGRQPART